MNATGAIAIGAALLGCLAAGCATGGLVPATPATSLEEYALTDPGSDLSMLLNLPTFAINRAQAPATSTFVFANDRRAELFFSATLASGIPPGDCRDILWERARTNPEFDLSFVSKRMIGELSVFDYDMRAKDGSPLAAAGTQRHLVGCRREGDRVAYVHVSRLGFTAVDETLFNSVLSDVYLSRPDESLPDGRAFEMPQGRRLVLDVPLAWWGSVWQPPGELPPTIKLLSRTGEAAKLELTAFWILAEDPDYGSRDDLRKRSENSAREAVTKLGAPDPALREWDDGKSFGYYYSVKFGDSPAYAYPYMTQGFARVDDLVVPFTISTQSETDPMIARALTAMQTARQERR